MSGTKEELVQRIKQLEQENSDLQTLMENVNDHSTALENDLEEKNKEINSLINKMKHYLSPQLYDSIVGGTITADLEYHRKMLTIFFSDIVNFTTITDSIEPEILSDCLNLYLNEMSTLAMNYGGTIDKFIGDGIMIFFGDPTTRGERDDAMACIQMALKMQEKIKSIRAFWNENGVPLNLQVRMGINTGYCTVGNFGSKERMDYTIIGGQVNIASRLESSANPDSVLISESTYTLVKNAVTVTPMAPVNVKGIHYPINTFEVKDIPTEGPQKKKIFEKIGDGFVIDHIIFNPQTTGEDTRTKIEHALRSALSIVSKSGKA
ncbi:MAG: adenylate/guanylate cyclase domain-containing protein [Spirochaetes bacterium]|nr:adenylate/guanylate cyclase domain-containing protein [Spirochaetota bacterium]